MFQILADSVHVITCVSVGPVSDCDRLWRVLTCISLGPVSHCDSVRVLTCISVGHVSVVTDSVIVTDWRVLTCISVGHISGRDSLRSAANNPDSHDHRK